MQERHENKKRAAGAAPLLTRGREIGQAAIRVAAEQGAAARGLVVERLGPENLSSVSAARRAFARWTQRVVENPWFERFIIGLIVVNAALLGLATDKGVMAQFGGLIQWFDDVILWIFVVEIAMRITAHGREFFRSGWSWFDMIVVVISFLPSVSGLSALRSFRILRILRLFSVVPKMRRVLTGFFAAIPGMTGIIGVLLVIFYVSAVIATTMFGSPPPGVTDEEREAAEILKENFGTFAASCFTLFQLMTLEDWAGGIVKPTLVHYPNAMLFFVPFIFVTAFAVLNLFIGIIVDSMQDDREDALSDRLRQGEDADRARDEARSEKLDTLLGELNALRGEVARLKGVDAAAAGSPRAEPTLDARRLAMRRAQRRG